MQTQPGKAKGKSIVVIACLLVDLGSTYEKQDGRVQARFKMGISASSSK